MSSANETPGRKVPTNALTRTIRDLALTFFLAMGVRDAQKAYSYRVDWDEKVA